jgi:hypothetical protein
MAKSSYVEAVDHIQGALRPSLYERGFRVRGRTFNRVTEDGLTQVVNIQMGASDPPGTTYFPGLRENMYGLFTINLGVYVPEVAKHHGGGGAKSWVQDYHCCVRDRLGPASGESRDVWWPARADDDVITDVRHRLEMGGLPFLDRYSSRDKILAECRDGSENRDVITVPRIVTAIILFERGEKNRARDLLARQVAESEDHPGHQNSVRRLANKLGLGSLDS